MEPARNAIFFLSQSMVIRLGTGPWDRFGISVMFVLLSSLSTFLPLMCGFSPRLKLAVHMHALMIVRMIRMMVITAKAVNDFRAGLYCSALAGWYIRTSLKTK